MSAGDGGLDAEAPGPDAGPSTDTADVTTEPDAPLDPLEALCIEAMYKWTDCVYEKCSLSAEKRESFDQWEQTILNGGPNSKPCHERAAEDPAFRARMEWFASVECGGAEQRQTLCGEFGLAEECACEPPTNLGAPCTANSQCDGGELLGVCDDASYYPGGSCAAAFCPNVPEIESWGAYPYPGCGEGNVCRIEIRILQDTNGNGRLDYDDAPTRYPVCVDGCTSQADCTRDQYACQVFGLGQNASGNVAVRGCAAACQSDGDCSERMRCNVDVGACEFECGTAGVSEPACTSMGGACAPDVTGTTWCVLP